jgi:hypothetical protein
MIPIICIRERKKEMEKQDDLRRLQFLMGRYLRAALSNRTKTNIYNYLLARREYKLAKMQLAKKLPLPN